MGDCWRKSSKFGENRQKAPKMGENWGKWTKIAIIRLIAAFFSPAETG
jgi:hypothetical protein